MSEPTSRAGARHAERKPRRSVPTPAVRPGSGVVALGLLVVAGLLVLVTPRAPGPADRPAAASGSPVREATLGCPRLLSAPERTEVRYGVGLADDDLGGDGSITTTPGWAIGLDRGQVTEVEGGTERGLVVEAEGGKAQGLFAWRADTGPTVSVADCPAPRASWWFTGAGAALDHESTLTLANLDSGPAVVDVRVLSPEGESDVSETGGKGITVAPGAQVALSLVELAPQADELAVWVHATRGRVIAAVSDRHAETAGGKPGYEWLPSQVGPARVVRLSGVPAAARSRTLLVANPGDQVSVLEVEVAGTNGRFVPTDLGYLTVDPASVLTLDLGDVLSGEAFAVRVRADRPVVASMRSVRASADTAYAGAAQPLRELAAAPVLGRTQVQLTGGSGVSRVQLTAYSDDGEQVSSTRLSLAARAIGTWDVPRRAAYVVAVPVQGDAYGSVVYSGTGRAAAAVPLRDLPTTLRVPVVQPAS